MEEDLNVHMDILENEFERDYIKNTNIKQNKCFKKILK